MSRHWRVGPYIVLGLLLPAPLAAQDESGETIDILVPPEDYLPPSEDCSAEEEAGPQVHLKFAVVRNWRTAHSS